jgi:hypothetical protein
MYMLQITQLIFIDILGLDDHDPDGEENNLVSVNVNGELFSLSLSDFITWFNNNFSNNEGNNQEDSDEDQNSENEEDEEDEKDEKDDSYIWWKWGIAFTSDEGNGQSTGFMAFNTYYVDYEFISIFALWLARAKGTENTKKVDSEKGKEVIEGQSDGPTPADADNEIKSDSVEINVCSFCLKNEDTVVIPWGALHFNRGKTEIIKVAEQ